MSTQGIKCQFKIFYGDKIYFMGSSVNVRYFMGSSVDVRYFEK